MHQALLQLSSLSKQDFNNTDRLASAKLLPDYNGHNIDQQRELADRHTQK
jgi:hypothetical protein